MMMTLLMELLKASVIGSITWIGLSLFKPLTQKVFSQTWNYYTRLLPALFLLGAAQVAAAFAGAAVELTQTITPISAPVVTERTGSVIEKTGETIARVQVSFAMAAPFILTAWLIGCTAFLFWKIAAYARFRRSILRVGIPFTVTECRLPILVCPNVITPMLIGVFKPIIALPNRVYNQRELVLILAHETAHWRRGDMLIKLLFFIVNALHWFNPLVYQMNKGIAQMCENACDEFLVRSMDKAERILYGEVILSTMAYGNITTLCAGMSAEKNLKRRLLYMLKFKKMKKPVAALSLLMACVMVAGGVWLTGSINHMAKAAEYDAVLLDETDEIEELTEIKAADSNRTLFYYTKNQFYFYR